MKAAEPISRGRGSGRASADAPAAEAKRRRDAHRVRRYRARKAKGQAIGRFLITEELVTALVASGAIEDRETETLAGIEHGVALILRQLSGSYTT